jgi:LCP family protein required for cell wall assembly
MLKKKSQHYIIKDKNDGVEGMVIFHDMLNFYKRHIKRLILVAGIVAGGYLFFATAFVVVALTVDGRRAGNLELPNVPPGVSQNGENGLGELPSHFLPSLPTDIDDGSLFRPPARTHFILIGLEDLAPLADAIMVGTFYRDSGEIRLMSVPRDTHIVISDTRHAQIRELGLNIPHQMKLTELHSYAGRTWGPQLVMQEVGDMLGVTFHHYVVVQLPAFRRIVDAIGGVQFNVPRRMYYYDYCTGFTIDLQPGMQPIDGVMAEQLVRFRGYSNADLGRNAVQMDFMKALLQQTLTREAIMNDPLRMIRIIIEDVRTNFTIMDAVRFLPYITSTSADKVSTFTMPGTDGFRRGLGSVFLPDLERLHDVAFEVFYANTELPEPHEDDNEPDEDA